MNCSTKCIKWCFFVFNFLWVVCGSAVYSLGLIVYVSVSEAVTITIEPKSIACIVMYVSTFAIAFAGCFGAIKDNARIVIIYAIFLLIIFVVEFAFVIMGFVGVLRYYNEHTARVDSYLNDFDNYWTDYSARVSINHLQSTKLCCGSTGPSYWDKLTDKIIPWSCCGTDRSVTCTKSTAFATGCVDMLHTGFYRVFAAFIGFNMGLLAVELVCFVLASILANTFRNIHRRGTIHSEEMTCLQ